MNSYIRIMNRQLTCTSADVEFLRREHADLSRTLEGYHAVISQNEKIFFLKKLINQTYIELQEQENICTSIELEISERCVELGSYSMDYDDLDKAIVDLESAVRDISESV